MIIPTIDIGATNTPVSVWHNEFFVCEAPTHVGGRDTAISGNRAKLQIGMRDAMAAALANGRVALYAVNLIFDGIAIKK